MLTRSIEHLDMKRAALSVQGGRDGSLECGFPGKMISYFVLDGVAMMESLYSA